MWATLALIATATMAADQSTELKLTNVRVTHGMLGPVRADSKILPGDALYVRFNIEGISIDEAGKSLYSMAVEVTNSSGRVIFKQDPRDLDAISALGGNTMPGFAHLDIGLSQDPGAYNLKVTVTDRVSSRSQTLNHPFQVGEPDFGIVRVTTSVDPDALHQGAVFEAGSTLWINGGIVGFGRDSTTKHPKLSVGVAILDEDGNKKVFEAQRGEIEKDVPPEAKILSGRFVLSLNRPGRFIVEVTATDKTTGKTSRVALPLRVVSANGE